MMSPHERTLLSLDVARGMTDARLAAAWRSRHGLTDNVSHEELEAMGAMLRRRVEAQAQENKEAGK